MLALDSRLGGGGIMPTWHLVGAERAPNLLSLAGLAGASNLIRRRPQTSLDLCEYAVGVVVDSEISM